LSQDVSFRLSGGVLTMNWVPEFIPAPSSGFEIYAEQFTDPDSEADQTSAFNQILKATGESGGGIVRYVGSHRIDGDLYIPERVALVGPVKSAGQISHLGAASADYDRKPGTLRLSSTATIRVGPSAYFGDAVVVRKGLNLPFASAAEAIAGISEFSGTAVTMAGNDGRVENILALGFKYAADSHNYSRLRFTDVQGDCINGIRVSQCTDKPYLTRCHFWPFTTANYTWTASDTTQGILTRPGIGFELKNTVDWAKLTDCFTYGYFRGYRLADVHANVLTACASDGPVINGSPVAQGSIGVLVEGNALDNKITDHTSAGASQGLFLGGNSGTFTEVIGCNNVACTIGINVRDGDAQIIGGMDRVAAIGLQVQSITSKVTVMRKMRQVAQLTNLANPANVQIIGTLT
jgi:hypothetical protein